MTATREGGDVVDSSVLDLTRLQEAFEDDVAGIADLLDMALGTGAKHTKALIDAIAARDLTLVGRAAHGIKGSASNIGAPKVTAVALAIEERARSADWDAINKLAADLEASYAELGRTVVAYRAEVL
jgi:HPt (histidine-containing phosphotransfer) domain-containing protein